MIKIDFEFDTNYGKYRDALYFQETPEDAIVESMKQERLNNWLSAFENFKEPEPETIEINGVKYEQVEVDGQVLLKPLEA